MEPHSVTVYSHFAFMWSSFLWICITCMCNDLTIRDSWQLESDSPCPAYHQEQFNLEQANLIYSRSVKIELNECNKIQDLDLLEYYVCIKWQTPFVYENREAFSITHPADIRSANKNLGGGAPMKLRSLRGWWVGHERWFYSKCHIGL